MAQFTFSGKIEFERKTNLHKLWEGDNWLEKYRDKTPTFNIVYFNLLFNANQSLYAPGRETEPLKMNWGLPPGADNIIHQNFETNTLTSAKNIFDASFLVRDSLPKHTWKISGEVRTIAGFKCRKAVTRICDSVYVVAFYTDEIPVSGGPEQMGGLPGMILELAVPRLFTTWVATQVELIQVKDKDLIPPSKGKAVTIQEMSAKIESSLKDWGKRAIRNVWWSVL